MKILLLSGTCFSATGVIFGTEGKTQPISVFMSLRFFLILKIFMTEDFLSLQLNCSFDFPFFRNSISSHVNPMLLLPDNRSAATSPTSYWSLDLENFLGFCRCKCPQCTSNSMTSLSESRSDNCLVRSVR